MEHEICLANIRNHFGSLTNAERQIAQYVLENSHLVVDMSVAALAEAAGTAGSAVIRFCKSIGYNGFTQFRLALAMELARMPVEPVLPLLSGSDSAGNAARKVFDSSIRTLQNTLSMLDFNAVEQLIDQLMHASRICFFGVGTSAPVAEDAEYRFLQLGFPAGSYRDILFMPVTAQNMKPGELAIAISHSGRTQATLQALQLARQQGAYTAAITSYRSSPLAGEADCALIAYPDDINYPVEAVSARIAHICILDMLSTLLALRCGEEARLHMKDRNRLLEKIRIP